MKYLQPLCVNGSCRRGVDQSSSLPFFQLPQFGGTRFPLRTWFATMWFVTSQKDGASALGLKRVFGLGSYQTAWAWLHKLSRAMVRPGRDRLCGRIEVDETYIGGSKTGKRGRGSEGKEIVVTAVEVHSPNGFGRVRMRRVPDVSDSSLVPFVCDVAEAGSEILTDGWGGYNRVSNGGYKHDRIVLSDTGDPAHVSLPGVHRIAALVKRWLQSTHQGSVSAKHLDYYLDEYTFRFNRRTSRSRGLLLYRLMEQAAATAPSPYRKSSAKSTTCKGYLRHVDTTFSEKRKGPYVLDDHEQRQVWHSTGNAAARKSLNVLDVLKNQWGLPGFAEKYSPCRTKRKKPFANWHRCQFRHWVYGKHPENQAPETPCHARNRGTVPAAGGHPSRYGIGTKKRP